MATTFATDGAQLFKGVLTQCQAELEAALVGLPPDEAGVRIHGIKALNPLLACEGCIGAVAASVLGAGARPVRAILFNKDAGNELVARMASGSDDLRAGETRGAWLRSVDGEERYEPFLASL